LGKNTYGIFRLRIILSRKNTTLINRFIRRNPRKGRKQAKVSKGGGGEGKI